MKDTYKVKLYVDGKLGTTVKVRSDEDLREMMPELLKRFTKKGRGKWGTTVTREGRITELHAENTHERPPRRKVVGFLPRVRVEPKCIQNAP